MRVVTPATIAAQIGVAGRGEGQRHIGGAACDDDEGNVALRGVSQRRTDSCTKACRSAAERRSEPAVARNVTLRSLPPRDIAIEIAQVVRGVAPVNRNRRSERHRPPQPERIAAVPTAIQTFPRFKSYPSFCSNLSDLVAGVWPGFYRQTPRHSVVR